MEAHKNEACPYWDALEENGFCVVPGVVPPEKCRELRNEIVKRFIEKGCLRGSGSAKAAKVASDPDVTGNWRLPYNVHGIFQHNSLGHIPEVWAVRKVCKPAFADLWGTDRLLCSFDGLSFVPKGKQWTNLNATWYHLDQGHGMEGLQCVQGLVTLNDMSNDDVTLSTFRGSHKFHQDWIDTYSHGIPRKSNFVRLDEEMLDFYREQGCGVHRLSAPAGSLVLWDSRTVHCNVPPFQSPTKQERMVVYVCMLPREKCPYNELVKRVVTFESCRMTSHWPYPCTLFNSHPRHQAAEDKLQFCSSKEIQTLYGEDREVAGLVGYDIE